MSIPGPVQQGRCSLARAIAQLVSYGESNYSCKSLSCKVGIDGDMDWTVGNIGVQVWKFWCTGMEIFGVDEALKSIVDEDSFEALGEIDKPSQDGDSRSGITLVFVYVDCMIYRSLRSLSLAHVKECV